MELQIPHCVCTKISAESILQGKASCNWENTASIMRMEYYLDTAGKNESRIAEYVRNQLKEDELSDQLVIPEANPFTGHK